MKSATNIKELYQVLTPSKFLTQKEAEFYVDVYGDQIKMIRNTVLYNQNPHHTVYVSGLSGSGKTTALNFLPNEKLEAEYEIKFLFGNELFDLADLDIIDVLLMLCFDLVKDDEALEGEFLEELNHIQESIRGQYEEFEEKEKKHQMSTGAKAEGEFETNPLLKWLFAFSGKVNFFADYRYNRDKRTVARKIFRPHISDLLKMTNQIIVAYMSKKGNNKQLLLIFHELNHIKNLEVIRHLFIDNRYSLERIHAKKVVTIPVALMPMPFEPNIEFLGLKIHENPIGQDKSMTELPLSEEANKNREALRTIVRKRVAEGKKLESLLSPEALENAIELSGGHIRQFVSLLHNAALHVLTFVGEEGLITASALKDGGAATERQKLSRQLIEKKKVKLLNSILTEHQPVSDTDETFLNCALSNQIFFYKNDDFWYDVNPLIKETVERYAKQVEESEDES